MISFLTLKRRNHSAVTSMDASHLYSRRPGYKDSFSMSDYQWVAREKFEFLGQTAVTLRCRRPWPFGRMIITGRPRRTCLSAIRLRGFSVRYCSVRREMKMGARTPVRMARWHESRWTTLRRRAVLFRE